MPWYYVDLFAGGGGASLGFRQAGAVPRLVVDSDHVTLQNWLANACPADPNVVRCLTIGTDALPLPPPTPALHLHSSPPCQSFSTARSATTASEAGEGVRLLRLSLDTALAHGFASWSIENVATRFVLKILDAYRSAFPHRVTYVVLDAADYGAPSSRKRAYAGPPALIAALKEVPMRERTSARVSFANRGLTLPDGAVGLTVSRGRDAAQNRARSLDDVAFTVTASHPLTILDANGKSLGVLTPKHSAALLGLPAEWKMLRNRRAAQRAIGNMVSPVMAKLLMECAVRVDAALPPPIAQTDLDAIDVHAPPPPPPPPPAPPSADAPSTRKRELDDVLDTLDSILQKLRRLVRDI